MDRTQRRQKAVSQVENAIKHLERSLGRLKNGDRLEDLEEDLTIGSCSGDATTTTCTDAQHDPDCVEKAPDIPVLNVMNALLSGKR